MSQSIDLELADQHEYKIKAEVPMHAPQAMRVCVRACVRPCTHDPNA